MNEFYIIKSVVDKINDYYMIEDDVNNMKIFLMVSSHPLGTSVTFLGLTIWDSNLDVLSEQEELEKTLLSRINEIFTSVGTLLKSNNFQSKIK